MVYSVVQLVGLLLSVVDIVTVDINSTEIDISPENAAQAQLLYSVNQQISGVQNDDLYSIVNEVAAKKKAILVTDPRVVRIKEEIILGNSLYPVETRFTDAQLDNFFPILAPFVTPTPPV